MTSHTPRRTMLATLTLLATGGLAAACGDDAGDTQSAPPGGDDSLTELQEESGVPAECLDAFPAAVGAADLADVALLPEGWPEPPVEATLCQTSATLDDEVEIASYATDAPPADVLDAYESALAASFETTRAENGLGELITGSSDGGAFEVAARDGAFTLTFSQG